MKRIFYNAHLIDENLDCDGAILVQDGKIFAVIQGNFSDADSARSLASVFGANEEDCSNSSCDGCKFSCELDFVNCNGNVLMPSFVDMHVHARYPGQTQKEDLSSLLNAAVAGGFGTVVLMPNTNPIVSSDNLAHSIESEANAQNKATVIQSVSLTKDFDGKTTSHLDDLSGIPLWSEDGHDVQNSLIMLEAMSKACVKGAIVACHCEDESFNAESRSLRKLALEQYDAAGEKFCESGESCENGESCDLAKMQAETYMEDANELLALAEDGATERNIHLAQVAGCKIHLCHVSTANSLAAVQRAWNEKSDFSKKVTCEVTPHHFGLDVTENRANLKYIVNPPIRSASDRASLIKELCNESNDNIVISTDHAPHTMQDKLNGAPGFPGLETSFAVANTVLVLQNGATLRRISKLMSANPSRILNLPDEGSLKVGKNANLVLVDTKQEWTVDSSKFYTKGKMCPFEGMELTGKVLGTWFRGSKVF